MKTSWPFTNHVSVLDCQLLEGISNAFCCLCSVTCTTWWESGHSREFWRWQWKPARSLEIAHVSFVTPSRLKHGCVWVIRNIMGHSHKNGKKVPNKFYMKVPLYLVEKWVNSSHQCPKITGLRVIAKAKSAKTNVFPRGDTYYQSSEKNSHLDWYFNIQIADPVTPNMTPIRSWWPYESTLAVGFHLFANVTQKLKKIMPETYTYTVQV